ncbi:MAG: ABC transporter substrate-binding protein, partial [Phocaeicola sp.]
GWIHTAANLEEALGYTMSYVLPNRAGANLYHQRRMLEGVLELQIDPDTKERDFKLTQLEFESAVNFLAPGKIKYTDFVKE